MTKSIENFILAKDKSRVDSISKPRESLKANLNLGEIKNCQTSIKVLDENITDNDDFSDK